MRKKELWNIKKLGAHKVYIDNDLTWRERRMKEKILEKAREMRLKRLMVKIK